MKLNYCFTQEKTIKRGQLYFDKYDLIFKLSLINKTKTSLIHPVKLFFKDSNLVIENNKHYTLTENQIFNFKEIVDKYDFIKDVDFEVKNNLVFFKNKNEEVVKKIIQDDSNCINFLKYVRENYHYVQGQKDLYRRGYYKVMSDVEIYNEFINK